MLDCGCGSTPTDPPPPTCPVLTSAGQGTATGSGNAYYYYGLGFKPCDTPTITTAKAGIQACLAACDANAGQCKTVFFDSQTNLCSEYAQVTTYEQITANGNR